MTSRTEAGHARPVAFDRDTRLAAMRAIWLVAVIAKQMDEHPDGTAHLALSAGMVGCVKDLIADSDVVVRRRTGGADPVQARRRKWRRRC
jgi:hypothetical protein